ncbi:MAG: alpha/beta fold hydrolase [Alteromonadaceae bacterium]|nr:alpha/beta fold hydrolase [Alteromonadaceae bacterium]
MAKTVIFVHGTWGGGWDYKHLAEKLIMRGYDVYRPSLTGLGERRHLSNPSINLDTHILDIVNLIRSENLSKVILVGHSYGGMVISGVAEVIPEKLSHLLYMDALLPENGESMFSLMGEEQANYFRDMAKAYEQPWCIPLNWPKWGRDVPHPIGTYEQAVVINNPAAQIIPATYVYCTKPLEGKERFKLFADRAKARGYRYLELPTEHNMQRTMPDEYIAIIEEIVATSELNEEK